MTHNGDDSKDGNRLGSKVAASALCEVVRREATAGGRNDGGTWAKQAAKSGDTGCG